MLDLAREIIGSQPILTAFLAIGLGYLVGQISIGGFSLGVGAVLFVGLAIGAFAPKAQITGPIGLTGLIMFLYGIGILYGRQFFEGMVGVGQKYNLLALVACLTSLLVALGLGHIFGIELGRLASDRADLDYIRVFVGKASAVGVPLASLAMPAGYPTHVLHVRRYDADLV